MLDFGLQFITNKVIKCVSMTKQDRLLAIFSETVKAGGGVHTSAELAFLMGEPPSPVFTKFLADCAKKGIIRRLANGIFESSLTPPDVRTALYQVVNKLRGHVLSYISLESQLSYTGDISQLIMDRVTIMTKGRSGEFSTPYGVIELIHTKQTVAELMPNLYYDAEIKMYRANKEQALTDLKSCKRNLHMLER